MSEQMEKLVEEIANRIATELGLDTGRRYWEEINLDEIVFLAITLAGKAYAEGEPPLPGEVGRCSRSDELIDWIQRPSPGLKYSSCKRFPSKEEE